MIEGQRVYSRQRSKQARPALQLSTGEVTDHRFDLNAINRGFLDDLLAEKNHIFELWEPSAPELISSTTTKTINLTNVENILRSELIAVTMVIGEQDVLQYMLH